MRILYIGGAGRSGSTIVDMILGNIPGFFSLGEIIDFWEHAETEDMLCGCGELIEACPFWKPVIHQLKYNHKRSFNEASNLKTKFDRTRYLPFHGIKQITYKKNYYAYLEHILDLYQTIDEFAGNKIVVDSSKTPAHLYFLSQIPSVDIRVLHLIRDPRAVAFSWKNNVKRDLAYKTRNSRMDQRSNINTIFRWSMENYFVELIGRTQSNYTVMKYEDFTYSPKSQLKSAMNNLGFPISSSDLDFVKKDSLNLHKTHSIGGNPMRFKKVNSIHYDASWKTEMSSTLINFLALIAFPLIIRHRYRLFNV